MEPPTKRSRPSLARGTIARVKLHNFMSYRDVEIKDPGAQLNCIIGPNGTGKSSIVCAMCVGLGGPLKLTERGDSIKACVHGEGKHKDENGNLITSAYVETELVDGHGPGHNLTVRLDFDVHGNGNKKWHIDGSPTTEKKVKEAMEALNIQVDNPLQFLPQDKVGQFSNLSPVELLKHTEMAIGPEVYRQHSELMELDKELAVVKQRLATEVAGYEDLERINRALEKDVERFKRLQENKRKLDNIRGKKLWVEADFLQSEAEKVKAELEAMKEQRKELQKTFKAKQAAIEPLETARKELTAKVTSCHDRCKKADAEVVKINQTELDPVQEELEKIETSISKLDRKLEALTKKREEQEAKLEQLESDIQKKREALQASTSEDPEAKRATLKKALDEATTKHRRALEAQREHRADLPPLRDALAHARAALDEHESLTIRKMQRVVALNLHAAKAGEWLQGDAPPDAKDSIGPLLMYIDVPNPAYQPLVEECIGVKYALSFLAKTPDAHRTMNAKITEEKWKVNAYMNAASKYVPIKRPTSASMGRFGVTCWLDEAVQIAPEHRDQILGALKDLSSIDRFLLGTDKTMQCIEELQKYLADNGVDACTVCTPKRNYRVSRSRYGDKLLNNTTSIPRDRVGLYAISVDEDRQAVVQQSFEQAKLAHDNHGMRQASLDEAVEQAKQVKDNALQDMQTFNEGFSGLHALEARLPAMQQRVEAARREEAAFDIGAKRAELQAQMVEAARREAKLTAKIAKHCAASTVAVSEQYAAQLALKVAGFQLTEARESSKELEKQLTEAKADEDRKKQLVKDRLYNAAQKQSEARKAAPQFERDGTGERAASAQATWDELPKDLDELDAEMASLEDEIASTDDGDDGKTLKDYERRCREIEAAKLKAGDTQGEIDEKQAHLASLTAEWKPKLEEMVAVVDENFAAYFRRFKCVGHVELSDGRKLNAVTGEPEGPDDFGAYKILIKVQWRKEESLHVLGEGGRDSGGERSVATMVYLISLQSVNPAPFRVVDEINQAMDSTNERHVFECITHACREGGKQYFLLTPKLLPDLDYGRETVIQLVLNGPYNVKGDDFDLGMYA